MFNRSDLGGLEDVGLSCKFTVFFLLLRLPEDWNIRERLDGVMIDGDEAVSFHLSVIMLL